MVADAGITGPRCWRVKCKYRYKWRVLSSKAKILKGLFYQLDGDYDIDVYNILFNFWIRLGASHDSTYMENP